MHLPTLIGIILLLNLILGGLLLVIYRLRQQQRCFLYWAVSCWVFVAGGIVAAARNYIDMPWVTHWLASILLIMAPLLALKGVQHFRAPRNARKWRGQILLMFVIAIGLALLYPVYAWISPVTSILIAGLFLWAVYLLVNVKASMQLPQQLLCLFFSLHVITMLLQAGSMIVALVTTSEALPVSEVDAGIIASAVVEAPQASMNPMLHITFISHLLLTTTTALMFPLLVFSKTEERLVELANIDDLTKLFNRRAFFQDAEQQFKSAQMKHTDICVLMVDLDYFKDVNDTWGHAVGDECLRWVAKCLKKELRDTDILARVGGEEFAIALPGVDLEKASSLSKRLCKRIAAKPVKLDNLSIPLSISIGGVLCAPKHTDFQMLLSDADKALYQAKENGRNQVVFA